MQFLLTPDEYQQMRDEAKAGWAVAARLVARYLDHTETVCRLDSVGILACDGCPLDDEVEGVGARPRMTRYCARKQRG